MSHEHRLSPRQQGAIPLILSGHPDREVAAQVGVSRETVTRWRLNNFQFRAELEGRKAELSATGREMVLALVPEAVQRLAEEIRNSESRHGVQAAVQVLRAASVLDPEASVQVNVANQVGPVMMNGERPLREMTTEEIREEIRQRQWRLGIKVVPLTLEERKELDGDSVVSTE